MSLSKAMQALIKDMPVSPKDRWTPESIEFLTECAKQKKTITKVHEAFVEHFFPIGLSAIERKMKGLI